MREKMLNEDTSGLNFLIIIALIAVQKAKKSE